MSKTLGIYFDEDQYQTVFFDGDNLITTVHENDGNWRDEYFNPIINHYGIKVKQLKKLSKKQKEQLDTY